MAQRKKKQLKLRPRGDWYTSLRMKPKTRSIYPTVYCNFCHSKSNATTRLVLTKFFSEPFRWRKEGGIKIEHNNVGGAGFLIWKGYKTKCKYHRMQGGLFKVHSICVYRIKDNLELFDIYGYRLRVSNQV